jgi:hypothetical protein
MGNPNIETLNPKQYLNPKSKDINTNFACSEGVLLPRMARKVELCSTSFLNALMVNLK